MSDNMIFEPIIRLVDDDEDLLDALSYMLESEGWKTRSYRKASDFLAQDTPDDPGCIVLDYQMPLMDGIELQTLLLEKGYQQPILFLTAHADVNMAVHVFKKGANDLLQKPVQTSEFLGAIACAVERDLNQRLSTTASVNEQQLFLQLTHREKQVLLLVSQGLMNCQVAERLNLSERTVEGHRASGYRRLGVKSLADLARFLKRMNSHHSIFKAIKKQ